MKQKLGLKAAMRPGPSGNTSAPNAANTDEPKVRSYSLPDPLITNDGKKVTSKGVWEEERRSQVVLDLETEMYGTLPANLPAVTWQVVSEKDTTIANFAVTERLLVGKVDNSSYADIDVQIELLVGIPSAVTVDVPLVMEFGFIRWPFGNPSAEPASYFMSPYEPRWKQQLLAKGWGYAVLVPSSIQPDHGAGLRTGIIGLANKGEFRAPEQWGVLRAWAWGASRAMDYFESDPNVDASRIGIEGTSRYGKAALVTMAFDERFSLGFIGSSGAGGASILRRNFGEQIENLASSAEYHWFCGNFLKYASDLTVDDLPVDAHSLVALCAPRSVFISVGSPFIEGQWVDAKGMFLGGVHASAVYELLGKKGLGTSEFPKMGTALTSGEVAFRQHAGGHSTGPNWSTWIAWASRYWGH
ncbi:acetylxylan esterase [Echinicola strongylocentroti]|uniref:Acetylxylan esterase n=2 Tax=Echinicola strongylocentroti TaxID=1795355 RepID=A0A2Z4IRJ0_9BACT|nr:acetylxylan esterase [Echinicola strongylocentroti]